LFKRVLAEIQWSGGEWGGVPKKEDALCSPSINWVRTQFELLEWPPPHAVLFSAVCSERFPFFEQPGKSPAEMQIFVRSVDRTFAVNVNQDASLSEVKAAIEDIEFIPAGTNVKFRRARH
jgi:hypothetical protein